MTLLIKIGLDKAEISQIIHTATTTHILALVRLPLHIHTYTHVHTHKAERSKNDGKEKAVQAHTTTGLRPARPDVFQIRKCGEPTYADILRILKGVPELKALQQRITRIRHTKAGELFLEMD